MTEVCFTDTHITIKFGNAPIPPVSKALKDNGFTCHKCVWRAKRTPSNEIFTKLSFAKELKKGSGLCLKQYRIKNVTYK